MPNLLELVSKAEAASRVKANAVAVQKAETAALEAALIEQISGAVKEAVYSLDLTPLIPEERPEIDLRPQWAELKAEIKKSAFIDRSEAMKRSMDAMTDKVVRSVEQSVATIPRVNLAPVLEQVRLAVSAIKFPSLMVVTKWEFDIQRDQRGFLEKVVAVADEWSEI